MRRISKISSKLSYAIIIAAAITLLSFSHCLAESYDLNNILKTYIKKNYPWAEIEITELSVREPISAMPVGILIEKPPLGKTSFLLQFESGKKIQASANVKAYDWIVITSKALRKGHHLEQTDVYSTLLDITKIPRGAITKLENAVGKQLERSVNANMPLIDVMVKDKTLVKKGQIVFLIVESPKFTIRTTGEIRANAYVGNRAKVINLASKKIISGVLIDENTVKVEF
jgi:flagella basal body P-ring formation protein FlgA